MFLWDGSEFDVLWCFYWCGVGGDIGFCGGKFSMVNGVLGRWCGVVDFGVVINVLVVGVGGFCW